MYKIFTILKKEMKQFHQSIELMENTCLIMLHCNYLLECKSYIFIDSFF